MRVILQFGRQERNKLFPDAPTARELAKDDRGRALISLAELPYQLSRPMVAPPGVPADRARALQDAFMSMQSDKDYLEEAVKLGLDVSPVAGSAALPLIEQLASTPRELIDQLKKLQHPDK